jgi:hypothetical protein
VYSAVYKNEKNVPTQPTSYEPASSTPSISAEVEGGTAGPTSVWPGLGKSGEVEGPATGGALLDATAAEGFANARSATSCVSGTARGWDGTTGTKPGAC